MLELKAKKREKLGTKFSNESRSAGFLPAEEGGFVVHIPSLPGCHTEGDTLDEAYKMAEDAISGYINTLKDLREEIPVESDGSVVAKIPVRV